MSDGHPLSPHATRKIKTPDGVGIAAQEWGRADGPELVFIHGFSMAHLCWRAQITSTLADRCRIVTYDLRGHAGSDKPDDPACYREPERWAGELAAVIEAFALRRPILVAWSYGGRVVADYILHHGTGRLAGVDFVGVKPNADPAFARPEMAALQADMSCADPDTNVRATVSFLRGCARRWDEQTLRLMIAASMLTPPWVRGAMLGRPLHLDELLPTIDVPLLFTHGAHDAVAPPDAAIHAHSLARHARLSIYDDAGHSPFLEEPERFNTELADFIKTCVG
jgi:non-heme chloroperoxidase